MAIVPFASDFRKQWVSHDYFLRKVFKVQQMEHLNTTYYKKILTPIVQEIGCNSLFLLWL
jgi:hypothetical protein